MSLPVNQIVKGGVYEGASGQQRLVNWVGYRVIGYYVQYTVVKVGAPPENVPAVGTIVWKLRTLFASWAVRRVA